MWTLRCVVLKTEFAWPCGRSHRRKKTEMPKRVPKGTSWNILQPNNPTLNFAKSANCIQLLCPLHCFHWCGHTTSCPGAPALGDTFCFHFRVPSASIFWLWLWLCLCLCVAPTFPTRCYSSKLFKPSLHWSLHKSQGARNPTASMPPTDQPRRIWATQLPSMCSHPRPRGPKEQQRAALTTTWQTWQRDYLRRNYLRDYLRDCLRDYLRLLKTT